jgi:hypothetical protein
MFVTIITITKTDIKMIDSKDFKLFEYVKTEHRAIIAEIAHKTRKLTIL